MPALGDITKKREILIYDKELNLRTAPGRNKVGKDQKSHYHLGEREDQL